MNTQIYIIGLNQYNGNLIRYETKQQAEMQGGHYMEIEATSFKEAKEQAIEKYSQDNQEDN